MLMFAVQAVNIEDTLLGLEFSLVFLSLEVLHEPSCGPAFLLLKMVSYFTARTYVFVLTFLEPRLFFLLRFVLMLAFICEASVENFFGREVLIVLEFSWNLTALWTFVSRIQSTTSMGLRSSVCLVVWYPDLTESAMSAN